MNLAHFKAFLRGFEGKVSPCPLGALGFLLILFLKIKVFKSTFQGPKGTILYNYIILLNN